jgi:tryptophan-rich sensory protein
VLTLVSLQAVQVLSNLTATALSGQVDANNALTATLKATLTQAMSHFARPEYVNITSIDTAPPAEANNLRRLADEPRVSVSYLIAYYLESTQYSTPAELEGSVNIALSVIMDSNLFVSTLQTYGVSLLDAVTTTALVSTSVGDVSILRAPTPTAAPTSSLAAGTDDAYQTPIWSKVTVGLIVGFVSFCGVCGCIYAYVTTPETSLGGVNRALTALPTVFALCTAAAAIALVSVWATDSGSDRDFGFLQVPSWKKNVFAYHPVFMVLFFALQVQALTNWSLFSTKLTAKTAHVLVQLASAATMVTALVAVVKYMGDSKSPSLVSVHSWIGAGAAAVFGFNFLWGSTMSYLTVCHPDSPLRARLPLLLSHKFLGVTALLLAALAVNTGIMEQLPRGTCSYQLADGAEYQKDYDPAGEIPPFPACSYSCYPEPSTFSSLNIVLIVHFFLSPLLTENYQYIPLSCKIANGLGIAVIVSAVCATLAVLVRNTASQGRVEAEVGVPVVPGTPVDPLAKHAVEAEAQQGATEVDSAVRGGYAVVAAND